MSKKAARRKTTKKPPALPVKPLRDLGGEVLKRLPDRPYDGGYGFHSDPSRPRELRSELAGVPLPPDLESAVRYYAGEQFEWVERLVCSEPWTFFENESEADYPDWRPAVLNADDWHQIRQSLECSFRQGFYLALLRYADDLKQSAEAGPVLERLKRAAKKGGAARRAAAEPTHKAVCKRFRELRKTVPKKTARYLRIANEFEMSDRHVARIVEGID